jgi:Rrf2 family protein
VKLITRESDYALRALCYIANHQKEIVTTAELVRVLKIPRPFLRKLLQILNKRKMLVSHKGKGGGFKLVRQADKIVLLDLIEIFQGQFQLNECRFKKNICPDRNICALRKKIKHIEKQVINELEAITLGSLL